MQLVVFKKNVSIYKKDTVLYGGLSCNTFYFRCFVVFLKLWVWWWKEL